MYLLPGGLRVALPTPRAGQARCGLLLCMPAGGATGASDSVQSRLPAVVPPAGTGQGPEKGRGSPKQGFAARRPEERPEANLSPVQGGDNCTHCIVLHLALACSRSALRALLCAPVAHVWRCARSVCKRSGIDLPGHDAPDHDAVIQDILHTLGFQTLGRLSHRRGHSGACRYARARARSRIEAARGFHSQLTHSAVLDTHAGQGLTGNPFLRKRNPRGMGLRGPSV